MDWPCLNTRRPPKPFCPSPQLVWGKKRQQKAHELRQRQEKITQQSLSQTKQVHFSKNELGEKNLYLLLIKIRVRQWEIKPNLRTPLPSSQANFHSHILYLLLPRSAGGWGMGALVSSSQIVPDAPSPDDQGHSFLTMVCTRICREISAPAPEAPPPILLHWPCCLQGFFSPHPSSLAAVAQAFFSHLKYIIPEVPPPLLPGSALATAWLSGSPLALALSNPREVSGGFSQKPLL